MSDFKKLTLKIGVPRGGTPSVFRVTIEDRDSAGMVERPMTRSETFLVAKALASLLQQLLE